MNRRDSIRGCLLGLAVGDAMGYPVDDLTLGQIRQSYGPNGLLGYDLCNGYADVTSTTQIAAFACNGLLLAMTRGQMMGKMAPLVKYLGLADKEWAASQKPWGRPENTHCWLLRHGEICRRRCVETRMLDTLNRENLGTPETPVNTFATPGGLSAAVSVGLFCSRERIGLRELDRLGAEAVALTHGNPTAFVTGAALTHMVARCLIDPQMPLRELADEAAAAVRVLFGAQYSQACAELRGLLKMAVTLGVNGTGYPWDAMEQMKCTTAAQVLAGAVYACLAGGGEFDPSMIIAVNHSGRSSVVAALTGALLGLRHGEATLPEFYMECLEPAGILRELADDMADGCPMERGSRLFDLDWDRKYLHGGK